MTSSGSGKRVSIDDLARLFEGRTRFVERLAQYEHPLGKARDLLRTLPESEVVETLNAHPRIGERGLSAVSAAEQGSDDDPAVLAELARFNAAYERKFGFRFVVFVNRRSRREILQVLQARMKRSRAEELATAIDDLVAIAEDRYRRLA